MGGNEIGIGSAGRWRIQRKPWCLRKGMHDIPPLITDVECGLPRRFNKEKVYAAGFATVWLCEPVQRECYGHLIEAGAGKWIICADTCRGRAGNAAGDRKSTRMNSSH